MASQFDPCSAGIGRRMRSEFVDGLKFFRSNDFESAVALFRAADEQAEMDDVYQNRYTSFHGMTRVCMGDGSGVKLCRKAAVGEVRDAEVYYNLAMAEHRLGYHESACTALRRGLKVDPKHAGLLGFKRQLMSRVRHGIIPGLNLNNLVNRLPGKWFRGTRLAQADEE